MRLIRQIKKFRRDQRGMIMIFVAISLATLIGFAVLSIDVGTMTLVKTQLQNAADAAVLAAVPELVNDDTTGAVAKAIEFAEENSALIWAGPGKFNILDTVKITGADVTFPEPGRITVTTHRTEATGDPFRNYFLRAINPSGSLGNMEARATAGYFWVCGGTCLKPWAPPDRWADVDSNGLFNADGGDYYDPITTGYTAADLGTQIVLVLQNGNEDGFGQFDYYSVDFPPFNDGNPISGADRYEEWMCAGSCLDNSFTVDIGDLLRVEPGKMTGPNGKGLRCIIDADPNAEWDDINKKVINSAFPTSPRIVKAALFDPSLGLTPYGGGKVVSVVKIMVIFIEEEQSNVQITGRFMRLFDSGGTICEDQSNPTFLYRSALLE